MHSTGIIYSTYFAQLLFYIAFRSTLVCTHFIKHFSLFIWRPRNARSFKICHILNVRQIRRWVAPPPRLAIKDILSRLAKKNSEVILIKF